MIDHPIVFISYSWTSDEYKENVLHLAEKLRLNGVDVILDQWDLKPGHDMYAFMEQSIEKSDKVLVLCDKTYTDKANGRTGGVGTETQIITPEVYNNCKQEKFIPVVMESYHYIPKYLKGRLAISYLCENQSDEDFHNLLNVIYDRQVNKKPILGPAPDLNRSIVAQLIKYDPESLIRPVTGVGQDHIAVVFENGHVHATGLNEDEQCNVYSWRNIVSVIGCWKGTIGLRSDGSCVSIGKNVIEDGTLFRWKDISSVAAGRFHVLGLKSDGSAVSFGNNSYNQRNVSKWKNLIGVAAGANHSVGLTADGTVIATGNNYHGQCEVGQWKNVKQIAASDDHTLALLNDGTVVGCGNLKSIKPDELKNAKAIATGHNHAVGLMENGCVVNSGTTICGLSDVERWHNIIAISAGFSTTIGVRSDGWVFVTHDTHKSNYLDTSAWKLFVNKDAEIMVSKFNDSLLQFKQALSSINRQAAKVSPFISEYQANVKVLDFSLFDCEYRKLRNMIADVNHLRESCASMPTIENITTFLLTSAMDVYETIEERDGHFFITDKSYEAFLVFIQTITTLESEVRMIEDGLSFDDLLDQQEKDFSSLITIPVFK